MLALHQIDLFNLVGNTSEAAKAENGSGWLADWVDKKREIRLGRIPKSGESSRHLS